MSSNLFTSGVWGAIAPNGFQGRSPWSFFSRFERSSKLSESKDSSPPKDRARSTGAALGAHYRFVVWLVPTLERSPRSQKFLLGDRIQHTALDVLERLIEATYTRRRGNHLALANIGIEKLRFLCRLAHDLRYLDNRRYEHAARSLDETGRTGGARLCRPPGRPHRQLGPRLSTAGELRCRIATACARLRLLSR